MIDIGFGIIELELGTALLLVSLVAILLDALIVLFGKYIEKWEQLSELSLIAGSTTLFISFGYFSYSVLFADYSFVYVVSHVSNDMDLFMRSSAIWSGQAGSYFFWGFLILVSYLVFRHFFRYQAHNPVIWRSFILSAVQVAVMIALTILANPFVINEFPPSNGAGLNPLLMNFWNIIHPPIIFIGYALCMIPAVVAVSKISLLEDGKVPDFESKKKLDDFLEFNISIAWLVLSSGIIIGGYWAYITLGWGGFWAWDPVETGSMIPWFFLTLYYHGKPFHSKNHYLKNYVLSMTYTAVIFATYITRSNILSSVHTFPTDDSLVLLFLLMAGTFLLPHVLGIKDREITRMIPSLQRDDFQVTRARTTALKISYITGVLGTYTIILGLIAPVIYGLTYSYLPFLFDLFVSAGIAFGPTITVGQSFYNTISAIFGGVLLITQFFCTFYPKLDIKKKFSLAIGGIVTGLVFFAGYRGIFDFILGEGNPITQVFKSLLTTSDKANLIIPLVLLGIVGLIIEFIQITMKETQQIIRKSSQTMLHLSFLLIILGAITSANMTFTQDIWVQQGGNYEIPGTSMRIQVIDIDTTLPPAGSRTLVSYDTRFLLLGGNNAIIGGGTASIAVDSVYGNDQSVTIISSLFSDVYIVTIGLSQNPVSGVIEAAHLQIKIIPYISILWVGCLFLHFAILPLTISRLIIFRETLKTDRKDTEPAGAEKEVESNGMVISDMEEDGSG